MHHVRAYNIYMYVCVYSVRARTVRMTRATPTTLVGFGTALYWIWRAGSGEYLVTTRILVGVLDRVGSAGRSEGVDTTRVCTMM